VFNEVPSACGEDYYDGGVGLNLPVPADWESYDEVWLLVATGEPGTYSRASGMITKLRANIEWMMRAQMRRSILQCAAGIESGKVRVLWPYTATPRGTFRFVHSLIERCSQYAADLIRSYRANHIEPEVLP
jgi:hypothetical protein